MIFLIELVVMEHDNNIKQEQPYLYILKINITPTF